MNIITHISKAIAETRAIFSYKVCECGCIKERVQYYHIKQNYTWKYKLVCECCGKEK
jgi:hypothetical protein